MMTPKQRKEWRDQWPAYGNVPPEDDYIAAGLTLPFKKRLEGLMPQENIETVAIMVTDLLFAIADESEDVDGFLELMVQKLHE